MNEWISDHTTEQITTRQNALGPEGEVGEDCRPHFVLIRTERLRLHSVHELLQINNNNNVSEREAHLGPRRQDHSPREVINNTSGRINS